jgi:transitional endoplasmic reticulum ATPase
MGKTLENAKERTVAAEVVHMGEKMVLPEGMKLEEAAVLIKRRMEYEAQETSMVEAFDAFPWDGAVQLDAVLRENYGWAQAVATPGFFGDSPPALINIETGYGKVSQVPWGRFVLPNVQGYLQTGATIEGKRFKFIMQAKILRRDENTVRVLFERVRTKIKTDSIYRGKAIRVNFLDDGGKLDPVTQPTFLNTAAVDPSMLVLSRHIERAVETNLFTPITRTEDCLANGIPVKRGILLGGTYGTGKTLIANVASRKAVDAGITFVYIQRATELACAIEFARQYQSPACVIFCEDIDREMDGARDAEMDVVLNTIDGIDSKTSNIIVVLTTNNIQAIHPAMLRPGRLDAVIDVTPPDGPAIERLIHVYAGKSVEGEDLHEVGEVLEGNIPAVIAEVVKRAKLAQLSLQDRGTRVEHLSALALLQSAETIQAQVALLNPPAKVADNRLGAVMVDLVREALNGNSERIVRIDEKVDEVHHHIID